MCRISILRLQGWTLTEQPGIMVWSTEFTETGTALHRHITSLCLWTNMDDKYPLTITTSAAKMWYG